MKARTHRELSSHCSQRVRASDPPDGLGGFLGLAATGIYSLGGFQVLIVVAGDQDELVRKLCMQGIGVASGMVHFSHMGLKEAVTKS